MRAYLRDQLEQMKNEARQLSVPRRIPKHYQTPLRQQIELIIAGLPPPLQNRPWGMHELTAQLTGRYRQHPHPQHVAHELRALGWTSQRNWSAQGYGRRIWYPPTR
jgi:hypothetical protein